MSLIGEARKPLEIARRWWLLALGTIVPMLGSYCLISQWPARYQAEASLMVACGGTCLCTGETAMHYRLIRAYADLVTREPIAEAVVTRLELDETPQQLADRIETTICPSPLMLQIQVTHTDPKMVALIANALADELIDYDPSYDSERYQFARRQLEEIEIKIGELSNHIEELESSLEGLTSKAEIQDARDCIAALEQVRSNCQNTYASLFETLHPSSSRSRLFLVEAAVTPQRPIPRKIGLIAGCAGLAGLEITSGVVSLARYWERRIRGTKDISR